MISPSPARLSRGMLVLVFAGVASSMAGCGNSSAPSNEADRASFRGSTSRMAPEERKRMEAAVQAAQSSAAVPKGPSPEQMEKAKAAQQAAKSGG